MKKQSLKTPLYGNCRVFDIHNEHIFNCSPKKCRWYLSKSLATIIKEEPFTIQLNFHTNGSGHKGNDYYLQDRENICVVCGSKDNLTRHHIVPMCYRRYFDENLKAHNSFDVLPICIACHEKYEEHANNFKRQICDELGIKQSTSMYCDDEIKRINLYASAILKYGESMPFKRKQELMAILRDYYGREILPDDLEAASKLQYNTKRDNYSFPGQIIVAQLTDIEGFIRRWREHFVAKTKPQHLPKYWSVDFPIARL